VTELECKPGVTPPILWIAAAVSRLALPVRRVVITSGNDGKHMKGSKHYTYAALDFRTKNFPDLESKRAFVRALQAELGPDYDVLLEGLGTANEHIHAEWDPK
jgi:hypothetical protein